MIHLKAPDIDGNPEAYCRTPEFYQVAEPWSAEWTLRDHRLSEDFDEVKCDFCLLVWESFATQQVECLSGAIRDSLRDDLKDRDRNCMAHVYRSLKIWREGCEKTRDDVLDFVEDPTAQERIKHNLDEDVKAKDGTPTAEDLSGWDF